MVASESQSMTLSTYMERFAPEMADRLAMRLEPLYDPSKEDFSPRVAELCSRVDRPRPHPAQAVIVEAAGRVFQHSPVAHLCGEMGTGKTYLGPWIADVVTPMLDLGGEVGQRGRWVVTCPNQLVRKWKKHLLAVFPTAKVVIVDTYLDLKHLRRGPKATGLEFYVIPRDRGKLSYAWRVGVQARKVFRTMQVVDDETGRARDHQYAVQVYSCPKCGRTVRYEKKGEWHDADISYFVSREGKLRGKKCCNGAAAPTDGPDAERTFAHPGRCRVKVKASTLGIRPGADGVDHDVITSKYVDQDADGNVRKCSEPLWAAHNGEAGLMPAPKVAPRRVSPAEYIFRSKIGFDGYIVDESHELKGGDTLQGQMLACIARRSKRVLLMTGTMAGGYATDLLHILWRTMGGRMKGDGLEYTDGGNEKFVKAYGVLRTETKYYGEKHQSVNDLILGRGKKKGRREKVLPGISPLLFSKFLMDCTLFIRLHELHEHLPAFRERVHSVPLSKAQGEALVDMAKEWHDHCVKMRSKREPVRAWAAARAAFLRWPDRPYPAQDVMDTITTTGQRVLAMNVPELPRDIEFPKERRLRRLIQRAKARKRKCWVFTEMTGPRWNVTDRLAEYLGKYGIRCAFLKSQNEGGPKPQDREEWIAKHTADVDVIFSNPNLVKTGLDLYDFPTIIFYYCGESTYTLRQASRRAWRLGQKEDCEVEYLVYSKFGEYVCVQSASLSLMAKKMEVSLGLEGDFAVEGLAAMADDDDMQSQLARVIAGTLQVEDPTVVFKRYRTMLESKMPSIVGGGPKVTTPITPPPVGPAPAVRVPEPAPSPAPPAPAPVSPPPPAVSPRTAPSPAPAGTGLFGDAPAGGKVRKRRSPGIPQGDPLLEAAKALEQMLAKVTDDDLTVSERKRLRRLAVAAARGEPAVEVEGDCVLCDGHVYHVVAKDPATFRDRNLATLRGLANDYEDKYIAFVQPGDNGVRVEDRLYNVKYIALAEWDGGCRTPSTEPTPVGSPRRRR